MKNTQDVVNDLVIRIKNAYLVGKPKVMVTHSNFKESLVKKLKEINFIESFEIEGNVKKIINIKLLYQEAKPAMTGLKIFSRPGRRWYVKKDEVKSVRGGLGYSILSTPKGLLTDKEARKLGVGGELLFSIW